MLSVGLIPENELSKKAGLVLSPLTGGPVVDDRLQTSVPGIFCSGNALQVHDVVDFASLESDRAGQFAASFADAGRLPPPSIAVRPGTGIRYVVPQEITGDEAVDFSMRVEKPDQDRFIVFSQNGRVLRRIKQTVLAPSSMIRLRMRADRFNAVDGDLTVEVAS